MTIQVTLSEEIIKTVIEAAESLHDEKSGVLHRDPNSEFREQYKQEIDAAENAVEVFQFLLEEIHEKKNRIPDFVKTGNKAWNLQDARNEFEGSVSDDNLTLLTDHICNYELAPSVEGFIEKNGVLQLRVDGQFIEVKRYKVNIHKKP